MRTTRGLAKTFKDQLEQKRRVQLTSGSLVLQWLVRWSAMVHSRFHVGQDGRTAWRRQIGRSCNLEVVPFGEKIWCKRLTAEGEKKAKLETDWEEGIWIGHARSSSEVLVGTDRGVVRAWAVKRLPSESRWDGD